MDIESSHVWPRRATPADTAELEAWLAGHGWEVDPMVYLAGAEGAAVQVRPVATAWADEETGLLILPGETAVYAGARIRALPRAVAAASVTP
ncbi:hypothetical protein ACIRBY_14600 [Streptomyces sp. NPDC096136]|uniref:hypothetical protein n=1 Tax=Streptomyces sp. NPDC096136 TaxID=3366076 RepID=UPI0038116AD1